MKKFILLLLLILFLPFNVQAEKNPLFTKDSPNVFIELAPEKTNISAGQSFTVAITQIIRPHWHTYWKNPGDSGEPMRVRWDLPKGFEAGELQWPIPQKLAFGPLLNYGHEGRPTILQTLKVPENYSGEKISIPVTFDILVCKEICIPESVEKELILNDGSNQNHLKHIEQARKSLPNDQHTWRSFIASQDDQVLLTVHTDLNETQLAKQEAEYFPYQYGLLANPAPVQFTTEGATLKLSQQKGDFRFADIEDKSGVLVLENLQGKRRGYILRPEVKEQAVSDAGFMNKTPQASDLPIDSISIFTALIYAVIGGIILNLMPCVFPVLSMKILSLCKISEHSRLQAQLHGLAYTAGIVLTFLAVAGVLILLKAGGSEIGWGFHLQNPVVLLLLAFLFFLIGLNLAGYFDIGGQWMGIGQNLGQNQDLKSSFLTGILATIVATPCTAPFMAAALGYALVQPPVIALGIFAALGLGLALPYLLISFIPPLQNILPRPGTWMITFKEILAFPMFATVIWLVWVLSHPDQLGINGTVITMLGLLGLTFGLWLWRKQNDNGTRRTRVYTFFAYLVLLTTLFLSVYSVQSLVQYKDQPLPEFGQEFSPLTLEEALESDQPVFVEMTAAWCITCKVNHRVAIDIPQTKESLAGENIIYLIGDWTNYNAEITAYLESFNRRGVPLYVYYPEPDKKTGKRPAPKVLPQILTPSLVKETLQTG